MTDSATWDRVLRRQFWRAVGWAVLCLLVVPASALGIAWQGSRADYLLDHGTEVTGKVVAVGTPRDGDGTPTVTVAYTAGGVPEQAQINRDSDRDYEMGEPVSVFYDPDAPTHVRTADEQNVGDGWMAVFSIPLLFVLILVPLMLSVAVAWARRRRLARRTGWRPVRVQAHDPVDRPQVVRFTIGGRRLVARATALTRVPPAEGNRRAGAKVAGSGRRFVLVLPNGSRRGGPRAVALKATGPRRTQ
ncbi:DUF3592 domain-containing protein [Amycolatopsis carbonis]|uniref:DUF3592 domain-containing protein n=1 Tax=Amycolatopsis carbonis TaxID=715471 RepID=A0A9Y2IDU0_9PSEU|nr:DUF3592 domain-containing protein [Amycolatopsis sp. 2-15]WIX78545.1 DUF3592 domain-containing protein [Amycolatopsis sp. 2-15]